MTHYETLGAARTATPSELRLAYRRAARASHPDRHGEESAERMAAVNEAWRVLGDAELRRRYDAALDAVEGAAARPTSGQAGTVARPTAYAPPSPTPPTYYEPAKFPWRFMAALLSIGVGFIALGVVFYDPPPPRGPDGILRPGDCVMLTGSLEAVEVGCGGHDAVVQVLVPFDQPCPTGTLPYRDRQGLGVACVVRSDP